MSLSVFLYFRLRNFLKRHGIDFYVLPLPKRHGIVTLGGREWDVGGRALTITLFKNDTNWLRLPMYADLMLELEHLPLMGRTVLEVGGSEGLLRRWFEGLHGCRYVVAPAFPETDIESLPYSDESMDVIVIDQVLEHLKRPWTAAYEILRVLKPGGFCVCTTVFMYPIHMGDGYSDYYRFSPDGLRAVFYRYDIVCAKGWGNAETLKMVYEASEKGPEGQPPMPFDRLAQTGIYDYSDSMNYLMTWCIARKPTK